MSQVNNRQFVLAWLKGGGRQAVARRTSMSPAQVSGRANYLRRRGVRLPKLDRPDNNHSADYLNNLIERKG